MRSKAATSTFMYNNDDDNENRENRVQILTHYSDGESVVSSVYHAGK